MRYREDTPAEQARARAAVKAWRDQHPGGTIHDRWKAIVPRPGSSTRQTSLILGPLATAPGTARATLNTTLTLWGLAHLSGEAGQITSELVTNAITASRAAAPPGTEPRPVTLWITARNAELCIRVWDPCPTPPPRDQPPPDPLTEHGRGLLIVTALSHQWGWHPAPNGGKYVWATLCAQPPPA